MTRNAKLYCPIDNNSGPRTKQFKGFTAAQVEPMALAKNSTKF